MTPAPLFYIHAIQCSCKDGDDVGLLGWRIFNNELGFVKLESAMDIVTVIAAPNTDGICFIFSRKRSCPFPTPNKPCWENLIYRLPSWNCNGMGFITSIKITYIAIPIICIIIFTIMIII